MYNPYAFRVKLTLHDEAPVEFQRRNHQLLMMMEPGAGSYQVRTGALALEFDQIREYARGDEIRAINWAASALVNKLMVNQYREEGAQQMYMFIDSGRVMEMPFSGITPLDYAITLDKAGIRAMLSRPEHLSIQAINAYPGLKSARVS